MSRIIEKYRKEAEELYLGGVPQETSWRAAILEAIFRPKLRSPPGKGPMTHLHPDIDKLHLPEHIYIADWRKYKVEDHPMLVNFQKRCHAAGLHDPWLRNYCYQLYPNKFARRSITAVITQQMGFGIVAGGLLVLGVKIYHHYFPPTYAHSKEYIEKYGTGEIHH